MRLICNFKVLATTRAEIEPFIKAWHYSGSINGCISDYCFKLVDQGEMIGAMFFGRMAMANQWRRFAEKEADVTELRRMCCIDETPKNTESFFIGKALKLLKKQTTLKTVVSYADAEYGHAGVIYKASNFEYLGKKAGAKVINYNGRKYHDKCIRTKYKGVLKPFAVRIKDALEAGDAQYVTTAGKHTYVYQLRRRTHEHKTHKKVHVIVTCTQKPKI
jgi:hypothetical protein